MNKINLVEVKPNSYIYVTCTCGRPIMVWLNELVHHSPFTSECSDYVGVEEKPQASFLDVIGL